jgi:hypothetical protein
MSSNSSSQNDLKNQLEASVEKKTKEIRLLRFVLSKVRGCKEEKSRSHEVTDLKVLEQDLKKL